MRVMLVTGMITYESFSDSSDYNSKMNPLFPGTAHVFDISTEDKYKLALYTGALNMLTEYDGDDAMDSFIAKACEKAVRPREPKINLSDASNIQKMVKIKEKYQKEVTEYNRITARNEKLETLLSDPKNLDEVSVATLEEIFKKVRNLVEEAPQVFIYEVE